VVAGAFVFANSIRTIYESVVFLFVVHPFDVGDGIFIGSQTDFYIVSDSAPHHGQLHQETSNEIMPQLAL
jgi:small-conductance mechanosensitive channel